MLNHDYLLCMPDLDAFGLKLYRLMFFLCFFFFFIASLTISLSHYKDLVPLDFIPSGFLAVVKCYVDLRCPLFVEGPMCARNLFLLFHTSMHLSLFFLSLSKKKAAVLSPFLPYCFSETSIGSKEETWRGFICI